MTLPTCPVAPKTPIRMGAILGSRPDAGPPAHDAAATRGTPSVRISGGADTAAVRAGWSASVFVPRRMSRSGFVGGAPDACARPSLSRSQRGRERGGLR